eukprot:5397589-Alexandrium_andersonii.AAC.2
MITPTTRHRPALARATDTPFHQVTRTNKTAANVGSANQFPEHVRLWHRAQTLRVMASAPALTRVSANTPSAKMPSHALATSLQ